jgi:hypothetical protein
MEINKRPIHRYSLRSSWIQAQDQENLDVTEFMGINRRAEKLKQMINQTNTEDRTEILKAQYGNLWKKIKKSTKRDK